MVFKSKHILENYKIQLISEFKNSTSSYQLINMSGFNDNQLDVEKSSQLSSSSNSEAIDPQSITHNDENQTKPNPENLNYLERIESSAQLSRQLSSALSGNEFPSQQPQSRNRTSSNLNNKDHIINENKDIPSMGLGKTFPTFVPNVEEYTVSFDGPQDPRIPTNWPLSKKLPLCFIIAFHTSCVSWASSVFSPGILFVAEEFHVGRVVATLAVSFFVLGFACGPVIWAPLSELYGRRIVLLISGIGFTLFQFATATGKDIQTVLICRFFGGSIGAAPMVVVPAAFADVFNNEQRGKVICIFVMTVFCIPILAPLAGSFITYSYLGWRWTEYITGIMGSVSTLLVLLFYKETHHPIILVEKAKEIKQKTGNWAIHAPHDEFTLTIKDIVEKNLTRPLKMLVTEPVILLISIYNAFIYGILYLMLTAYPVIFAEGYKMHGGVSYLPYLGLIIGFFIGGTFSVLMEGRYIKALRANNNKPVPEARLPPLFVGSIAFPIGIFWLFWTGNWPEKIHWMAPTASGIFTGIGLLVIFNASINYIIDSYLIFAASAMAANTFLRSSFACAFPLFGVQMLHGMHLKWAGLLLALVGVVLIPVPFLFYAYGKKIRTKSKYAFVL
ncbi:putative membrane protein [Wickerhamomyces ciferrii]|uniref:Membrane protein n=1 Tax=Wickerhamomyces ciferrii (strain ATCC 14091 / BCRC 22168 / CBS 111 / JCM 3599 / NBRC 0793 / NRRL Y-1031 F-60-10) TaxID=1206466 RepID=K0KGV2_WICCF|nr:uncharacterized protein BN7_953 [Wickerhamomyces ciferrii]CCH41412.1 putative membrane protein [Wickerhamomyces ciferrii]